MEEIPVTEAVSNVINQIKAPNILVLGKTGVGKSSLINAVFGEDLAKTGAGFPITENFNFYSNGLVNIYDSAGYTLSKEMAFTRHIFRFLEFKQQAGIEEQIHIAWYVINASSGRVELFDLEIINRIIYHGLPLLIILSQSDRAKQTEIINVKTILLNAFDSELSEIIEVSASPLTLRGKPICEPFGLKELVDKTINNLPKIYADAVRMAQIVDLKSKRELVWKFIAAAALVTFSSAWIPIPVAVTGVSLGVQESLAVSIASVYGFGNARELLPQVYSGKLIKSTVSVAGATLGVDILRSLIPIFGNIFAGATAATLIVITGLAYASAYEEMVKAHVDPRDSETVEIFFRNSFREALKKYSHIAIKTTQDLAKVKDIFINQ